MPYFTFEVVSLDSTLQSRDYGMCYPPPWCYIKLKILGKDGSVFSSFLWNGINGPLQPFLNKSKKKKINIAGKMRLNDWKGKKNVDFVIEDVSLNQFFNTFNKLFR